MAKKKSVKAKPVKKKKGKPSVLGFIAWLDKEIKKNPKQKYNFTSTSDCLGARYQKSLGRNMNNAWWADGLRFLRVDSEAFSTYVFAQKPNTYKAARVRADQFFTTDY